MTYGNIPTLRSNSLNTEYANGGIIIYKDEPLLKDRKFIKFLNVFFEKLNVDILSRLVVIEKTINYTFNLDFLSKVTEDEDFKHLMVNQLVIFKNRKVVVCVTLDSLIEEYNKIEKKL